MKFSLPQQLWNRMALAIAVCLSVNFLLPMFADAATLNQAGVRLGRLSTSATTGNDLLVTFKLRTTPTSVAKIKVTFPSGFTITTGTPTPAVTGYPNTPASIAAPPGTLTSAATNGTRDIVVSGLTSASLNATSLYGFIIPTGTVANPSTSGQYNVTVESQNAGGTTIDTTTVPVYVTNGAASDQVTVNASVSPNFSFSLSGNSDTVPAADPTTIQTSTGVNMVVSTNSPLGYTAYVKSTNGALTSATSSGTPINDGTFNGSPDTVTAGTSMYGLVPTTGTACTTCTGTITYDGEFAVSDGTHAGSFNGTSFASFMSRSGYTNADTISLKERVAVSNTIGYASDYTDTLTIVAAGNY